MFPRVVSRRDVTILFLGAGVMYLWALLFASAGDITVNTHLNQYPITDNDKKVLVDHIAPASTVYQEKLTTTTLKETETVTATTTATLTTTVAPESTNQVDLSSTIPETTIVQHAPGWTVFRNLYMAHDTLYIVTSKRSDFPLIRMMTSTGLPADHTPGNEESREPTTENMDFLTPEEAQKLWGADYQSGETANRILSVEGNTWLFNDPRQFLRHYYHFVAELLLGTWIFWTGTFTTPSWDVAFQYTHSYPPPPKVDRMIFIHTNADGWRDSPGFDTYFFRAVLPSISVEHEEDWKDRVAMTTPEPSDPLSNTHQRAWHFPLVLLADRSAAFRGESCGSRTQRTASEALEAMIRLGKLPGLAVGGWWSPLRSAMWRYAGVRLEPSLRPKVNQEVFAQGSNAAQQDAAMLAITELPMPETIVITYISRQGVNRRKLVDEDHAVLVLALKELVDRKGSRWELQILEAESMTKDQQVRAVSRSTIMLGVHGNGLTHLVLMPPTRVSTVIEIFYPGGFAHDYQWTTHALGMKHFGVWNDTHFTMPNKPEVDYPEGFQGNYIPVHGPTVAKLIEDRVEGRL